MSNDISRQLQEWPYDPRDAIRIVPTDDGRLVLQVRLPLGIEQYELDGRPDGAQIQGYSTVLEAINQRLQGYIVEHAADTGFSLSEEDAERLQAEAILFYYRYLMLFQVSEYERVERDTEHNLRVCELLDHYGQDQEIRTAVLQFKPYIMRMHAMARVMQYMQQQLDDQARTIVDQTIADIEAMDEIESPGFQFERLRSLKYLYSVRKQISEAVLPVNPVHKLRQELSRAVADENYERAAEIRDRLRNLGRDD